MNLTKRFAGLILAAALCAGLLAGCGGKGGQEAGPSMKEGESVQTVVDRIVDEVGMQMPAEIDDGILKDLFYIDPASDAEEYYGKMAMTMTSADNVVAVKAKPEKRDAVKEALQKRLKDVQDSFAQYLPEQGEKAQKGQVIQKGDYVFLLILGEMSETFDSDMEAAVKIVNDAF